MRYLDGLHGVRSGSGSGVLEQQHYQVSINLKYAEFSGFSERGSKSMRFCQALSEYKLTARPGRGREEEIWSEGRKSRSEGVLALCCMPLELAGIAAAARGGEGDKQEVDGGCDSFQISFLPFSLLFFLQRRGDGGRTNLVLREERCSGLLLIVR